MEYIIDITYKYILYIKIREGSGINTKDQEEGGGAGLSESPRKIKSREVELGPRVGQSFASIVPQQLPQFRTLSCDFALYIC